MSMTVHPGALGSAVEAAERTVAALIDRIWERDHTVWQNDPSEVADRLGWLDCPTGFLERADELTALAAGAREDGIEHVLLVGMGGSSLYPEVLADVVADGTGLPLDVLDTTHPAAVARLRERFDPRRWLLVPASKSGTTIETRSHLERFFRDLVDAVGEEEAGRHVIAITDPGSALAQLGHDRGFRAVVENPPDIGGRFSALSAFGLVPAALLGIDVTDHLDSARTAADRARSRDMAVNEAARLGAFLGSAATAGRAQLTLLLPPELQPFGAWVEQLVAESTGKHDVGLLPILGEPVLPPQRYGPRRVVVAVGEHEGLDELVDAGVPVAELSAVAPEALAAEVFRWEFATAVCGALLGINPFDQPDVQAAKTATTRVLESGEASLETQPLEPFLEQSEPVEQISVLGYVDPGGKLVERLEAAASALRDRFSVPVTVGIGPRYLHSTGQWHKGGPDLGVYIVVVEDSDVDVDVPGRPFAFGELLRAQAAGDLAALRDRGRRVALVDVADLPG